MSHVHRMIDAKYTDRSVSREFLTRVPRTRSYTGEATRAGGGGGEVETPKHHVTANGAPSRDVR